MHRLLKLDYGDYLAISHDMHVPVSQREDATLDCLVNVVLPGKVRPHEQRLWAVGVDGGSRAKRPSSKVWRVEKENTQVHRHAGSPVMFVFMWCALLLLLASTEVSATPLGVDVPHSLAPGLERRAILGGTIGLGDSADQ